MKRNMKDGMKDSNFRKITSSVVIVVMQIWT